MVEKCKEHMNVQLIGTTEQYIKLAELTGVLPILHHLETDALEKIKDILNYFYVIEWDGKHENIIYIDFGRKYMSSIIITNFFRNVVKLRKGYRRIYSTCNIDIKEFGFLPPDKAIPLLKNGGGVYKETKEQFENNK